MRVLIVQSRPVLAEDWQRCFAKAGALSVTADTQQQATSILASRPIDVILLDLILREGAAFAVADYAQYRQPHAQIIVATDSPFFADGSIFSYVPNARAFVPLRTPPEDLLAMAEHFASVDHDLLTLDHVAR
ncbi:MAG: hypothetical protein AAF755_02810 [Pseudomonadota bacterium]